jgi:hypothetical protein
MSRAARPRRPINAELVLFRLRRLFYFLPLALDLSGRQFARVAHRQPLTERHRTRLGDETGQTGQDDRRRTAAVIPDQKE